MKPETTDDDICAALRALGGEFQTDELAFLAATSKVEGPVRDRLAFMLHRNFESTGFAVSREWNRVDIAVLDATGIPVCLIEAKAMYTFDAFYGLGNRLAKTVADEVKARAYATPMTAVFSLLLATHAGGRVEDRFLKPVKYAKDINSAIEKRGGEAAVRDRAISLIHGAMTGRMVITHGTIDGGQAFNLPISVLYWLVRYGPFAGAVTNAASTSLA